MNDNYKGKLQEYCQREGLPFPKYGLEKKTGLQHYPKFQAYVQIGNEHFIGNDSCRKQKDAEQSAAQVAYTTLNIDRRSRSSRQSLPQQRTITNCQRRLILPYPPRPRPSSSSSCLLQTPESTKHMPVQYADSETFIINIISLNDGRIRKIWAPDEQGNYQFEIAGTYRYCENIDRHHKKNHIYFLVNPDRRTYCQRCHDPDCSDYQSPIRSISGNEKDRSIKRKSNSATNNFNPKKRERYDYE